MANVIHGVVRTDAMLATSASAGLFSFKYFGADGNAADIDNGCVVKLDGLMEGERELYKGISPAADTALSDIVLVGTPEVMYDERLRNLADFYNEAGTNCRGYMLHTGDTFSVTTSCVDAAAEIVKGDIVELQADTKLKVVKTPTAGSTKVGVVYDDVEQVGTLKYVVIRVA